MSDLTSSFVTLLLVKSEVALEFLYFPGLSVMSFITTELTRGYLLERDKAKFSERRQRVYTFMKTPRELEKVFLF